MIDVDVVEGVTTVRFDHPPVNALDLELLDAIVATMQHLDGPVVVTGAGKCFSAGVDLRAIVDGGSEYTDRFITSLSAAFLAVFDHPAPVVAAVNGHAIAGGCVSAMSADVRLMSAGTIGITELAVGVPFPMAALEICRYAMGTSATRAALQADTIDVASASARGWIYEVVAPADLIPRAIAVARELGQHSPTAYAATKEQLHRPARTAIDAGAETDAKVRASWMSDDTRARLTAFIDALAARHARLRPSPKLQCERKQLGRGRGGAVREGRRFAPRPGVWDGATWVPVGATCRGGGVSAIWDIALTVVVLSAVIPPTSLNWSDLVGDARYDCAEYLDEFFTGRTRMRSPYLLDKGFGQSSTDHILFVVLTRPESGHWTKR